MNPVLAATFGESQPLNAGASLIGEGLMQKEEAPTVAPECKSPCQMVNHQAVSKFTSKVGGTLTQAAAPIPKVGGTSNFTPTLKEPRTAHPV